MCGIVAILNVKEQTHELREQALKMSQKIRHRGRSVIAAQTGVVSTVVAQPSLPTND